MEFNDKQLQIIETAERLFANAGFDGTSVRDIAEEAGVNVAMISYYFGSKEKLLEALFHYRGEGTVLKLESMVKNKVASPVEKMNMLIDYYIDKFMSNQCFNRIMIHEQVALQRTVMTAQIQTLKKRNQALVKQLIQEGQKSGHFAKNIDIPILMATLIGTVTHIITTQHFYRQLNNMEEMTDEQFQTQIKKKLSTHLKFVFKAILTHEG